MTRNRTLLMTCGATALLLGCGASGPSPQLVQARTAYKATASGPAAQHVPARVLDAKETLDLAERADDNSAEERQFAYLASRQAALANAEADLVLQQQSIAAAEAEYQKVLKQQREEAESRLASARAALRDTVDALGTVREEMKGKDAKVDELNERRAQLEKKKAELEQTLGASEAARKDAEARAAAALASLKALGNVKEEAKKTVITLSGSVLFETGKSTLLPMARESLAKVAEAIKNMDDDRQIVVEGHTDSRGADTMNYKLSLDRAASVRQFLVSEGVDPTRIVAEGKGESRPIADNASPEGRANNRRVEIHINKP